MRPALILALSLTVALPATAGPNAQLVTSVQHRLNVLGFRDVDAGTLSTAQIAALHLYLDGPVLDFGGFDRMNARSRVKVILGWE